jgi:uncharacterized protein YifE (UPF0438 family)
MENKEEKDDRGYSKRGDVSVSDTRLIRGYGYSDTPFQWDFF